jgi:hypothetical protein
MQAIPQLFDARAATGARAAALADLLHRLRAVVDDRVDFAIRLRVTQADQH